MLCTAPRATPNPQQGSLARMLRDGNASRRGKPLPPQFARQLRSARPQNSSISADHAHASGQQFERRRLQSRARRMQQAVQAAIEQQVLRAAQEVESQIDAELHKLETLDDDDIERLRQKRIDELKR